MDLFLKVTTNVPDLIIDYIEVKLCFVCGFL